ncbi:hypothetical protein KOI35_33485 [Actinoplanes bogorensis]|uniref:Glucodextranase N-terminal domain-containing protein n=1 Tax=Paractinoplanes bogorensis TaxID=1610840 RepID=A0ABS5YYB0_9ACTN|nr:hypothetical protein [Actinoplanes bogorensis]MBU2668437.1 hypothetical protein [Actinoplanes bogorensis]
MDWHYRSAGPGSLMQTAEIRGGHSTPALSFAASEAGALAAAKASLRAGFGRVARDYAYGWKGLSLGVGKPPIGADRKVWTTSALVLAAADRSPSTSVGWWIRASSTWSGWASFRRPTRRW